ncbi:MAG TPA: UPF0280 family protein [Methanocorpusculum sp.]|nr:UPF0280 family protein [Methanocorpusculum sp.]
MIREHFEFKNTITTILSDNNKYIQSAKRGMIDARLKLESYIVSDPFFEISYSPVETDLEDVPTIVKRMSNASKNANVGPMASVAATIAWAGIDEMIKDGATFGLIDNGGDIVFVTDHEIYVGIYAGSSPLSGKYAFVIPPTMGKIQSICTSSATVGPSISFGIADAVIVISDNPAYADAWATKLCNTVKKEDTAINIPQNTGISGVYAIMGTKTLKWGDIPKIVPATVNLDLITRS